MNNKASTKQHTETKKSNFVHLHCHSEYSSLDGGSQIKSVRLDKDGKEEKYSPIAERCQECSFQAMALTDHGVMQGLPSFYEQMKAQNIKPILGIEAYLTDDRHDRNARKTQTYHLTLLAETTEGYKNLCRLSSRAFIDGTILTFGRPRARADYELLEKYSKGVICLTGCMAAPTMRRIFEGDYTAAYNEVKRMIDIFGINNVYGEVQNVGIVKAISASSEIAKKFKYPVASDEEKLELEGAEDIEGPVCAFSQMDSNMVLKDICDDLGIKLVATGDVHYLREDDAMPHDAMLCIGTAQIQKGNRKFKLLPKKYHMRSEEEMRAALPGLEEAITNTVEIAERCNAEIEFHKELLPKFPIPENFDNSVTYLHHLCEIGMEERYGPKEQQTEEQRDRLADELSTIVEMGFPDYFLIVWDLFNEARKRAIPAGPGRGSAAGSIVAYVLGITQYCPLQYGLLFERFLNPGRKSMPDIDMDFSPLRREELIDYAREKYNELANTDTAVAQIITYSRFKPKGALRDATKVLAEPNEQARQEALKLGDKLASYVPDKPANISLRQAYKESEQLKRAFHSGGLSKDAIEQAQWLEGMIKANSVHAAAVIIADHALEEDLPLQQIPKPKAKGGVGPLHAQYDMGYCEQIGLLKMDFLGLRNLDVIQETIDRIKAIHGIEIPNLGYDLPLDDAKTFELACRGESVGTFQFESSGMQAALREVQPSEFRDLVALVALYRPGPMENIPVYANIKQGKQKVNYLDERLGQWLDETYSVIVYQEQSMEIAKGLAGFDRAMADDLRKAIGKKIRSKMDELKKPFYAGCLKNNVSKETVDWLWHSNEKSADYSFNKSHAVCYAGISYITMYLKANYPNEYMASLLSSVMGKKDMPRLYLTEAKRMGLTVLPPDVNRSLSDFAVLQNEETNEYEILFGLTAIRGVGTGVVKEIREEREANGPFVSLFDLIRRMPNLNKTVVQNLVLAGALDSTKDSRKSMFEIIEDAQKQIKKELSEEQKAFYMEVRGEFEELSSEQEQLAQDSLFSDLAPKKTKKTKLEAWQRKAIEGIANASWKKKIILDEKEIYEEAKIAIEKAELTALRAAIRKSLKNATEQATAGIAAEEGGDTSQKDIIEEQASQQIKELRPEIRSKAKSLVENISKSLAIVWQRKKESQMLEEAIMAERDPLLNKEEWSDIDKLNQERKVLGIYVTGHPLDKDAHKWNYYVDEGLGLIGEKDEGKVLRVVGALVDLKKIPMRSGETMFRVVLEDLSGSREAVIFPRTLEGGLEALLEVGNVICMEVSVQEDTFKRAQAEEEHDDEHASESSEKQMKLIASRIYQWDASRVKDRKDHETIDIEIEEQHFTEHWVNQLKGICEKYPGEHPVRLKLGDKSYKINIKVEPSALLAKEVKQILV